MGLGHVPARTEKNGLATGGENGVFRKCWGVQEIGYKRLKNKRRKKRACRGEFYGLAVNSINMPWEKFGKWPQGIYRFFHFENGIRGILPVGPDGMSDAKIVKKIIP